jgi:hypothetical protein
MRRQAVRRQMRAEVLWVLAGFAAVQLALGLCVDRLWPGVRDPEFDHLLGRLRARSAEAAGRPLVVALGSSRTQMGLRAGRLSGGEGPDAPLVFNLGVPAGGPMMQQVALRRLLAAGVRPDLLLIEVLPLSLARRGGTPLEERMLDPARLDAGEAAGLLPYYHQPHRLVGRWAAARALPAYRHQAELRDALGLDVPALGRPGEAAGPGVDGHGWRPPPGDLSPEVVEARTRLALQQYDLALRDCALAERPARALRDLLALCRREGIPAVVVMPPEGSRFRAGYGPAAEVVGFIRRVAAENGISVHDARTWVADDGFWDGHHLWEEGADRYTERLGREVLRPLLRQWADRPRPEATAGR